MDRRKLLNRVYLHFGTDPSITSDVEDYVIDVTANTLDLFRGKIDKGKLKKAVRLDVVGTFGLWVYFIWSVRIARLIAFIWEQYHKNPAASTTAKGGIRER